MIYFAIKMYKIYIVKNLASPIKVMLENDISLNKIIQYHASP